MQVTSRNLVPPPSVRAIEANAFRYCISLTTAILNDGLEVIGKGAFYFCALVRIDIPPTVRVIKDWAFYDCSYLTTAILNDGLKVIEEEAFHDCSSLRDRG